MGREISRTIHNLLLSKAGVLVRWCIVSSFFLVLIHTSVSGLSLLARAEIYNMVKLKYLLILGMKRKFCSLQTIPSLVLPGTVGYF